jgi:Glycosyl-transferase for dystroglycan
MLRRTTNDLSATDLRATPKSVTTDKLLLIFRPSGVRVDYELLCFQVYEMTLAGWTFHVLSPIFTIHWGLQSKQRRPSWRRNQMEINRRLFDTFIHPELKARYGQKSPVRWHPKPAISNRKTNSKPIAN